MDIETKINELDTKLAAALKEGSKKTADEIAEIKAELSEAKAELKNVQRQADAQDIRLAERHGGGTGFGRDELKNRLQGNDDLQKFMRGERKDCQFSVPMNLLQRKTTVTEDAVGASVSGVLPIDRIAGITPEARQRLFFRDLFVAKPTDQRLVDFVRVSSKPAIASPQTEASDKGENAVTFTSVSEAVRCTATWIPASRQVLDDLSGLMDYLQVALPYYVSLAEEKGMLFGSGTGEDLHGIGTQATGFDTSLLTASAGWTYIDVLAAAVEQIQIAAEIPATWAVLNPVDWWRLRRTKSTFGTYIMGDPAVVGTPKLWDLNILPTINIPSGTFLVGSGSPIAAEIRNRMEMQFEIATQHSDFFSRNLIALRAEVRSVILCKRPGSFIVGTFNSSPA